VPEVGAATSDAVLVAVVIDDELVGTSRRIRTTGGSPRS
jgi:hypothetical protein